MSSEFDSEELPLPPGPGARVFRVVITLVVFVFILGVPLATWVGKKFFGWTPPPYVEKALQFFETHAKE